VLQPTTEAAPTDHNFVNPAFRYLQSPVRGLTRKTLTIGAIQISAFIEQRDPPALDVKVVEVQLNRVAPTPQAPRKLTARLSDGCPCRLIASDWRP
jgi:hypothetical protein